MKLNATDAGMNRSARTDRVEEHGTGRPGAEAGTAPAERSELSRLGTLLGAFQSLEREDPARYRRAVDALSRRLDEAAAAQPSRGAELFEALARKLRQGGAGARPDPLEAAPGVARYARAAGGAPAALEDLVEAALEESA